LIVVKHHRISAHESYNRLLALAAAAGQRLHHQSTPTTRRHATRLSFSLASYRRRSSTKNIQS